jgi:hypothetical protein
MQQTATVLTCASYPTLSLTFFFFHFYKRKASFILGAARVRKRNQNDVFTLVKKNLICFLCSFHIHNTSFFLFFFPCRSHVTASLAFLNFFLLHSFLFFLVNLTASILAFFNFPLFLVFYKISHSFLCPIFFLFLHST